MPSARAASPPRAVDRRAATSTAEPFVVVTTAGDFARARPDAVPVSRQAKGRACARRFALIAHLARSQAFAETWARCRLVGENRGVRLFLRRA